MGRITATPGKQMENVTNLNVALILISATGFAISYCSLIIEVEKERNLNYQALCDINDYISCSKAFMSDYGKGFGLLPKDSPWNLPNSLYGLVYYMVLGAVTLINQRPGIWALLGLTVLSNVLSIYLASILYILKVACILCISTYVLNAIACALSVRKLMVVTTSAGTATTVPLVASKKRRKID